MTVFGLFYQGSPLCHNDEEVPITPAVGSAAMMRSGRCQSCIDRRDWAPTHCFGRAEKARPTIVRRLAQVTALALRCRPLATSPQTLIAVSEVKKTAARAIPSNPAKARAYRAPRMSQLCDGGRQDRDELLRALAPMPASAARSMLKFHTAVWITDHYNEAALIEDSAPARALGYCAPLEKNWNRHTPGQTT
jgi:hypothetical protein